MMVPMMAEGGVVNEKGSDTWGTSLSTSCMACYMAFSPLALSAISFAISDSHFLYPKVHFEMFALICHFLLLPLTLRDLTLPVVIRELRWVHWLTSVSPLPGKGEGISPRQLTCSQHTKRFPAVFLSAGLLDSSCWMWSRLGSQPTAVRCFSI